jgi:hypothetical protein
MSADKRMGMQINHIVHFKISPRLNKYIYMDFAIVYKYIRTPEKCQMCLQIVLNTI